MAKITFEAKEEEVQTFKKGDLVFLREGENHLPKYHRRAVIVAEDSRYGDYSFKGFCLVDSYIESSFKVASFELATCSISLSN